MVFQPFLYSKQEKTGYQILSEMEEEAHYLPPQAHSHSVSRRKIVTIGALVLFPFLLGAELILLLAPPRYPWFTQQDCNCGSSIKEALEKGCKYDPMATSWLPSICRDDELIDEFNHAGPGQDGAWAYYTDQSGNRTMTLEEVAQLAEKKGDEAAFWTTHEWHLAHCLFYWKKESRARKSGKVMIEKSFEGEYHVKHCAEVFQSCRPLQEINTRSSAGLNSDIMT
ncbi:hypothetical protein EYZ11_011054 [Aspergillus tanneri]|uniref:Uncharacterized protein n=1 Tax=Aspergillus tanneri TaxID=1220188 RepID=A0A4V3UN25_9EURO|nr:hypothetical protein EYZ11_011054 [Aspergillus tanneri]